MASKVFLVEMVLIEDPSCGSLVSVVEPPPQLPQSYQASVSI